MAAYSHIRLELAREPGRPLGDPDLGYDIVAPLDAQGRLDPAGWRRDPSHCRVRRFREGETEAVGTLAHVSGGRWVFDFGEEDRLDEAGYRLEQESFQPGDYVSIRMTDGQLHPFRVVSVRDAEPG